MSAYEAVKADPSGAWCLACRHRFPAALVDPEARLCAACVAETSAALVTVLVEHDAHSLGLDADADAV